MQFATTILNAMLAPLRVSPAFLEILDGSGKVLLSMSLPDPWITAPNGGAVHKAGVWKGEGVATGKAVSFVISTPLGDMRGAVGKELLINNPNITTGRALTITQFSVQLHA